MICPRCKMEVPEEELRCPRCLESLLVCKSCSGNCLLCLTENKSKNPLKNNKNK